ncbi:ribosome small subunit-dependent GTPase A [Deinococcus sp. SL84]|uniref:ribosome small subunit-dependent GTPase A n=1 Tax=Deinococcus sp. SL84 TaxID=2994663 RepID=UPI002273DA15|nr:ribosome small subunit-dependent GTPase A [Deinococcus sp. SL84]MCY1704133.1 ribosome small subunit-dependent GTPase A [Deinococcus sp. SL84]
MTAELPAPSDLPTLTAFGYGEAQAQALAAARETFPGVLPARVSRVERNGYRLRTEAGEQEAVWPGGRRHKLLDVPVIGDWVGYSVAESPEGAQQALRIEAVLARQNTFIRSVQKGRRTQPQVLAANVDTVFVMTSPEEWDTERLERYVQAVQLSQAQPVILLNKLDLAQGDLLERAQAAGLDAPVLPIAAESGQGLDALRPYLAAGQTVALIGSSGMGKSTLTNRLLGEAAAATGSLSDFSGEGRHTTTWRTLYRLPVSEVSGGALLIDNPGLRDIAVWDEEGAAFWAIEELAAECRFSRCTHGREPGCAVRAAVLRGELDEEMVGAYREAQGDQAGAGNRAERPERPARRGEKRSRRR